MLVKVPRSRRFLSPDRGTRWRGKDEAEDRRLEREMLADQKERAEHIMLVDLGRNDLGRVCEYGSVRVEKLMTVERYSHVMHLVSSLRGTLREDVDCFDALMACFLRAPFPARRKSARWKLSKSSKKIRRGIYAVEFSISISRAISIPASRCAPWLSRMASHTSSWRRHRRGLHTHRRIRGEYQQIQSPRPRSRGRSRKEMKYGVELSLGIWAQ